jgi:hypothetical protein
VQTYMYVREGWLDQGCWMLGQIFGACLCVVQHWFVLLLSQSPT